MATDHGNNVKPRFTSETIRPDGKKGIVYGNQQNNSGRIIGQHGHSVRTDTGIDYSRTIGGKTITDKK